ncbi:protoglobin domain-containing protein [Pontibacterium sp.]|uniref:protoglobin domain-containing protein n=1 Tax=Pontibacterium sp. TaxID=2036026 RepID=UPI0035142C44
MSDIDYAALAEHGKGYAGFTAEDEALLLAEGAKLIPHLGNVTDGFYTDLQKIPAAMKFLEGRLESLKRTHQAWLERIFSGPYDGDFAQTMHHVGEVHVRVKLPVEFMSSGIVLINNHLCPVLAEVYADDPVTMGRMMRAVNAVTGYSLIIMQESYQTSLLAEELERFLAITGMSRKLFDNLANAYRESD